MRLHVLGIDPGKSGAVAFLRGVDESCQLLACTDMPVTGDEVDPYLLRDWIYANRHEATDGAGIHAAVERVASMPKQGVASVFKFGDSFGVARGVASALGLSVTYYRPAVWKKALHLGADKNLSRQRAIQLWPECSDWFARKKDDGRAEAALLAYYHYCLQIGVVP